MLNFKRIFSLSLLFFSSLVLANTNDKLLEQLKQMAEKKRLEEIEYWKQDFDVLTYGRRHARKECELWPKHTRLDHIKVVLDYEVHYIQLENSQSYSHNSLRVHCVDNQHNNKVVENLSKHLPNQSLHGIKPYVTVHRSKRSRLVKSLCGFKEVADLYYVCIDFTIDCTDWF